MTIKEKAHLFDELVKLASYTNNRLEEIEPYYRKLDVFYPNTAIDMTIRAYKENLGGSVIAMLKDYLK